MTIERKDIVDKLIQCESHHLVKFITGIRRCGKSFLLFNLFQNNLRQRGIDSAHIIAIDLEKDESSDLRDPIILGEHLRKTIPKDGRPVYVLIDEIQYVKKVLPAGVDLARIHPDDRDSCYVTFYRCLERPPQHAECHHIRNWLQRKNALQGHRHAIPGKKRFSPRPPLAGNALTNHRPTRTRLSYARRFLE